MVGFKSSGLLAIGFESPSLSCSLRSTSSILFLAKRLAPNAVIRKLDIKPTPPPTEASSIALSVIGKSGSYRFLAVKFCIIPAPASCAPSTPACINACFVASPKSKRPMLTLPNLLHALSIGSNSDIPIPAPASSARNSLPAPTSSPRILACSSRCPCSEIPIGMARDKAPSSSMLLALPVDIVLVMPRPKIGTSFNLLSVGIVADVLPASPTPLAIAPGVIKVANEPKPLPNIVE